MNILQTIWTSLTNENELLTKIVLIPESFLENYISFLLYSTILNINVDYKNKLKYIIIFSILSNISNFFIINPLKSLVNLLLMLICIKYFFKTNIFKTILALIIPTILTVLCESILIKFSTVFLKLTFNNITNIPLYRLIYALVIQLLLFIVFLLIRYCKIKITLLENISKKTKNTLIINLIYAIIIIFIQFIITGYYSDKLPLSIVLFSNLSIIFYFLLTIYSIIKTTQYEIASLNYEQERENNKILNALQDELRAFRHDFANIMCTIGGYANIGDIKGLQNYYSQIQVDLAKVNNLGALNPDVVNNPAIYVLLTSKYNKAHDLNIDFNINIFLNLNNINMKIYEFTRVLGILLDNAIEAAKECEIKKINLEIINEKKRNRQLLIITNTYNNKDVDTEKIYEKNYTSKPDNSGLGLWEVRKILKRNTNLNLFTSKNGEFFSQQLEMYYE